MVVGCGFWLGMDLSSWLQDDGWCQGFWVGGAGKSLTGLGVLGGD